MQDDFLNKYDILQILGLELNETEQNNYINEISETTIKKAFYRLYKDGHIEEELFNKLEPIILSNEEDYDITDDIIHIKDELEEYLKREVNDYKKLSLLKQIEDFLEYIKFKKIQDPQVYETTNQLADSINSKGENFDELLEKYNQLKIHHGYKSSI